MANWLCGRESNNATGNFSDGTPVQVVFPWGHFSSFVCVLRISGSPLKLSSSPLSRWWGLSVLQELLWPIVQCADRSFWTISAGSWRKDHKCILYFALGWESETRYEAPTILQIFEYMSELLCLWDLLKECFCPNMRIWAEKWTNWILFLFQPTSACPPVRTLDIIIRKASEHSNSSQTRWSCHISDGAFENLACSAKDDDDRTAGQSYSATHHVQITTSNRFESFKTRSKSFYQAHRFPDESNSCWPNFGNFSLSNKAQQQLPKKNPSQHKGYSSAEINQQVLSISLEELHEKISTPSTTGRRNGGCIFVYYITRPENLWQRKPGSYKYDRFVPHIVTCHDHIGHTLAVLLSRSVMDCTVRVIIRICGNNPCR